MRSLRPTLSLMPPARPLLSRRSLTGRRVTALALLTGVATTAALLPGTSAAAQDKKPAAAAPAATPAKAAEKFTLAYRAKTGQVKRGKGAANFSFDFNGSKWSLELKSTEKVTYTGVAKNGDLTYEATVESSETTVNGNKMPSDEKKPDVNTVTMRPNGTLVGFKSTDDDKDNLHFGMRIRQATSVIFPEKPVAVGDKWTQEYKSNTEWGTRDGRADFEVLGTETAKGIEVVHIKLNYTEQGSSAITCAGVFIVEKATGDTVSADYKMEGVPLPMGPGQTVAAGGNMIEERLDGGPLPAAEVAKLAPPTNARNFSANAAAKAKEEPKKDKTIDEVVKEFEKSAGVVTLYRKKEANKDTIYLELPEDKLGKLMMLQATASTGNTENIVYGDPINDILFKFEKNGDEKILMVVPNWYYRANNKELARSLDRSFADGYLAAFKVEAKQPERKSLLLDVSDLFKGDIAQISAYFSGGSPLSGSGSNFGMDREKTYIKAVKNFPDNLVVSTQYHFQRGGRGYSQALADSRSSPIVVTYNLFALPTNNGYVPRLSDPRVGFFETEYQSFDDDSSEDPFTRFILRWDLKKKDPTAALSEPIKPIVFWMDNAIPAEYRDAVRDGILMWNKAYEKVGFKDAVVVKQMPDNPDPKDPNVPSDTADMRFNCIRWVVSPGNAYAVALFRPNPLTGEILNASITVDAGIVRYTKLERKSMVEPAARFWQGTGVFSDIEAAAAEHEHEGVEADPAAFAATAALFGGIDLTTAPKGVAGLVSKAMPTSRRPSSHALGHIACNMATEKQRQAWFGHLALDMMAPDGLSKVDEKEYTNQFIREVVAHEMGHILGLRHNFIASTELSMTDLANPEKTKQYGIGASVMDYNPFNIAAIKSKGADFFSQTVGTYDQWAVEYGYTPVAGADKPEKETAALKEIAKKNTLPGNTYQSDEVADRFDPMVTRFDLGADNIAYYEKTLQTAQYLLKNLGTRRPRAGESYYEFTQSFQELLGTYAYAAAVPTRYIGGLNVNRNHKGDPNEKPALVPTSPAQQKRALQIVNQYIFSPKAFQFPEKYYTSMASYPYQFTYASDFPIGDQIANIQKSAVRRLFSGSVLTRVANNEFKTGGDAQKALTLPYLFNSVNQNVWAELSAPNKNVSTLRRQLQRQHLDSMTDMILKPAGVPEDAKMLAWGQIKSLKARLTAAQKANPNLDEYTRVHYTDSVGKIDRVLNAGLTLNSNSGPSTQSLLQMLLGKGTSGEAGAQR